jgi:hypothetical protein
MMRERMRLRAKRREGKRQATGDQRSSDPPRESESEKE